MSPPPTPAQQKALALAPIPFAFVSFLSSSYVIYYLLGKERGRLGRLYHRLVLAMNAALMIASLITIWSPFAVPEDTPGFFAASGNVETCTASGFLGLAISFVVPLYYTSLSLQAFMGARNNFQEEKVQWMEKWIHIIAWCIPSALASVPVATENYNPSYSGGCGVSKAPRGCEADPDLPCERGRDIESFMLTIVLGLIILCFVLPLLMMACMHRWIQKIDTKIDGSVGLQKIREAARKEMLCSVAKQMAVYILSFWLTWTLILAHGAYQLLSDGEILFGLLIPAQCVHASQGSVFAFVYFTLDRLGKPRVQRLTTSSSSRPGLQRQLTVSDIRLSATRLAERIPEQARPRRSIVFNIFSGAADEDSPWAEYINDDDDGNNGESDSA